MQFDITLLDALPDAFLAVRKDSIVWANDAAASMLGASRDALVGRPFCDVLAEGERERLRLLEIQRQSGWDISATCKLRFIRVSDGAEVATDLRFGHATAEGETVLVVAARDVTEATRAHELMGKLAELFARGSAMLEADALLDASETIFEALGWKAGFTEIVDGGSITRRIMAAPPGDPVGDYVRSIAGVKMPFERTPVVAEVVRTGRPLFLDNIPTLMPGATRNATLLGESMARAHTIRSAWCPISIDGRLTHVLSVTGRDLTEHDFVAVQLFAAQMGAAMRMSELRAELVHRERLAAVGEMAAVMAHEVRNPLGVIFNAISGLRKSATASGSGAELLDIIHEEAERLRRLVTDLLDFSRPSAAQMQGVSILPVMKQAIEAARHDPSCADCLPDVAMDVPTDIARAQTDPLLLRRALVNLLVNAFQCVPRGGKVTVSAREEPDAELHLRIHNDGPAIPPEVAQRVFEPFFTTKATGTGLGLAVVRRILEEVAGRIELDAAESGTSFSLWLPVATDKRSELPRE